MPRKQHVVRLSGDDRRTLQAMVRIGHGSAWVLQRARILLLADAAPAGRARTDAEVAAVLNVAARTVARTRAAWSAAGQACLTRKVRATPPVPAKLSSAQALQIAAVACTAPPPGFARWSLRLLATRIVEVGISEPISHETLRQTLKKTTSPPGASSAS